MQINGACKLRPDSKGCVIKTYLAGMGSWLYAWGDGWGGGRAFDIANEHSAVLAKFASLQRLVAQPFTLQRCGPQVQAPWAPLRHTLSPHTF